LKISDLLDENCITGNGWRYETLGISELLHYQGTANFDARTKARITNSPPMFYDRVLYAGVYSFQSLYQLFSSNLINLSIPTNLPTKHKFILFFCAWANLNALWANWVGFVSSLTKLWIGLWLVELWQCACK